MTKPVISYIVPFDATKPKTILLSHNGNLPYANRIIIYDASTMFVVYDKTQVGFTLQHTIPANVLTNGKKYVIQGQVIDNLGNESLLSDKLYFLCLATPLFYFENISEGN